MGAPAKVAVGVVLALVAAAAWSLMRVHDAGNADEARALLGAAMARCAAQLDGAADRPPLLASDPRGEVERLRAAGAAAAELAEFLASGPDDPELAQALAACAGSKGTAADWRTVLAQPDVRRILERRRSEGHADPGPASRVLANRGAVDLGRLLSVRAGLALDAGDGDAFLETFGESVAYAADLVAAREGWSWFPGVVALSFALGLGRLDEDPGVTAAEAARAAAERLAAELPAQDLERIAGWVRDLRARIPAARRALLAEDLWILGTFRAALESGALEPRDVRRAVETLEGLRAERLAILEEPDLERMAAASDAFEGRLREASKQLLSGRASDPDALAASLGIRGPFRMARQLEGARETCDAFLGALGR